MSALPCVNGLQVDAIAAALADAGACRLRDFPDDAATFDLRNDLLRLSDIGAMQNAGIGRSGTHQVRSDIRGDATLWLDDPRCGDAARAHLAMLDALRIELDRRLFLGLHEVEAHYAAYPPGAGYARHRDRFRDSDARVLSIVSYLNTDWHESDGGALSLHLPSGSCDILPMGTTSICFLSELEHEVLPATRERLSVAGWMRHRV